MRRFIAIVTAASFAVATPVFAEGAASFGGASYQTPQASYQAPQAAPSDPSSNGQPLLLDGQDAMAQVSDQDRSRCEYIQDPNERARCEGSLFGGSGLLIALGVAGGAGLIVGLIAITSQHRSVSP